MKINRDKKEIKNRSFLGKTDIREIKKENDSAFEQELFQQREKEIRYQMQKILEEIDKMSRRLNKSLTVNDLMVYKKLVKNFLQEAISKAFLLKQERGRSRRGRTLLVTINIVDTEIEKLIKDFINEKKGPMEILATIDKIRGMLVDLMV